MPELCWYADDVDDAFNATFSLSWKLRRGDAGEPDLGSAEFHPNDQRWWGRDYTRCGPPPVNCVVFGPFEQLEAAQHAVEESVGARTLADRFESPV